MAKNPNVHETSSAPQIAAVEVDAGSGGDSRSIVLSVPMTDGSQKSMKRTDYIRARWSQGADRGTIRKEVEKLQGKPVPYQVIFAATKNQEGGPTKTPKTGTETTAETATDA